MEGERGQEASEPLPEELMGKIVAMVPFPALFKARLLSKAWLSRFQPISSLHDKEEKRLAAGFQQQVRERSRNWETFSPVCVTEEDFFAYSNASQKWRRLPPLRFLPKELFLAWRNLPRDGLYHAKKKLYVEGVFLYGTWLSNSESERSLLKPGYFVANILTQKWRKLLPPPHCDFYLTGITVTGMKLVSDASLEAYKLILSCGDGRENCPPFAQIFDSKSETWTKTDFVISVGCSIPPTTFACLNGVLYGLSFDNLTSLAAFNVEDGTMEERIVPSTMDRHINRNSFISPEEFDVVTLIVRSGRLLLVHTEFHPNPKTVHMFEINVESLLWQPVAFCRHEHFGLDMIDIRVSEGNSIFVELDESHGVMLVYDKHRDGWRFTHLPKANYQWSAYSFQPGLNPFMEV